MARALIATLAALFVLTARALAADSFRIEEPASDSRVFDVTARLEVSGQLQTKVDPQKARALPLKVAATHSYLERRLSGGGRDAEAYRSLRHYQQAETKIEVDKEQSSSRLSEARRTIVAEGRREGISCYSPNAPMTRAEIDLLQTPGDSLAMLALLPRSAVEVGEKWTCEPWVIQTLANVDAVQKSSLVCEVLTATADLILIKLSGSIDGATVGAATSITLTGKVRFDRRGGYITGYELEQKEKRSVGAISPGMDVTAKVTVERQPASGPGPLTDAAADKVPLEPDAKLLLLTYETPWGVRIIHDRDWHLFHDTGDFAMLRLIDKGALIAQCNLKKMPPAGPGRHVPEEVFQSDIQKTHSEQFQSFANAELVKTDDGRYLYRVTALGDGKPAGDGKPRPIQWIYYLCATPGGEQCTLCFELETSLVEKLANRDLAIVKSLQILKREPTPSP